MLRLITIIASFVFALPCAMAGDASTPLLEAVLTDDVSVVAKLLDSGADPNAANRYGVTPLSVACMNGNAAVLDRLLMAGADPNTALRGGETPLMTAARTGRLEPVQSLIAKGAEVNARERRGQTALMWAASEGHAAVVQALIDAGADFRTPLPSGFTPLCFAARDGRADVARVLIAAGADVNEPMRPEKKGGGRAPNSGTTPLILAVENGHFELALALVEAGADPNDQRSGEAPLHVLCRVRKPNRGDGIDGEPAPTGSGSVTSLDFARRLVGLGADVNLRLKRGPSGGGKLGRSGATPFLIAADTADAAYMRTLVEIGADPLLRNEENTTPLLAAAGVGTLAPGEEAGNEPEMIEAVAVALELGGGINDSDDNGETVMHGAALKNYPRLIAFLASRGADPEVWNRKNRYGWTPLDIARGHRHGNFRPAPETLAALETALTSVSSGD